ncbi:uncharacterized protein LOC143283428 [Babylonia areolata]|uniref:uncharacterized protein LOC143283428 n=1 Tax=Babylonia areolata TaxID=304850 RepID=UPI003FD27AE5
MTVFCFITIICFHVVVVLFNIEKMADNNAEWSDWEEEEINELLQRLESENENSAEKRVNELSEAMRRSRETENLRHLSVKINNRRLGARLKANSMERVEVPADRNCFFRAASLHLNEDTEDLRQNLCIYMMENVAEYINFLNIDAGLNSAEKLQFARAKIDKIRRPGQFNSEANDILPLVLADYCNRRVKIFTTRIKQAINIKPRANHQSSIFHPIYLALPLQVGVPEHYDGAIAVKQHIYSMFNPGWPSPATSTLNHPSHPNHCHHLHSNKKCHHPPNHHLPWNRLTYNHRLLHHHH